MKDNSDLTKDHWYGEFLIDLETLTNIDSGSRNVRGLCKVADYLSSRLQGLGFDLTREEDPQYGPFLVARRKGTGTAKILCLAHMDTVWPEGTALERPFRIAGDFAYGPGVNDCRSGMLSQYYMARLLEERDFNDFAELILVFNPDEELGSPWSGEKITILAEQADAALIMEGPTFPDEFITSRAGTLNFTIEVLGRSSHSGVAPEKGRNAIMELAYKLVKIQEMEKNEGVKVNVAAFQGGEAFGIVAERAIADLDFRVSDWNAVRVVERQLEDLISTCTVPDTITRLEKRGGHPPFPEHPETKKFAELVIECGRIAGLDLKETFCGGASDASYTALGGAVTLDGLQPWGTLYHTADEYLDLKNVVSRIEMITLLVQQISLNKEYWIRNG